MKGTVVTAKNAIPNWEISGFIEYIKSGHKQGDMVLVVPAGAYAVRLGNEASIKQRVKVTQGLFYSLTFNVARTCAQEEKLNVSVSPNSEPRDWGILPMQTMYSSNGWDAYAWAFQADGPEVEISIHNPGVEEDAACGPLIDSVALKLLSNPKRPKGNDTNVHDFSLKKKSNMVWLITLIPCFADNLLKNGNFEEGPYVFPNADWGVLVPPNIEDDHCPLPGWMVDSLKAVKYIDSDHFTVPEGKRAVELVAGKESAISQVVKTTISKIYALTFSVGDTSNSCVGSMVVEVYAGKDKTQVPYESNGKGGFKHAKFVFKAISNHTRITFLSSFYTMKSDNSGSLCGPVLDDVKLVSVRNPRRHLA
jgi:hypothetical protein